MSNFSGSMNFLGRGKVLLLLECVALALKQKGISISRKRKLLELRDIYVRHCETVWGKKE